MERTRVRLNRRWEWFGAGVLVLSTLLLTLRACQKPSTAQGMERTSYKAVLQLYERELVPKLKWGDKAPDFTVADGKGGQVSLSGVLQGSNYVVLSFLGGGKSQVAPLAYQLNKMGELYKGRGVTFLTLDEGGVVKALPSWFLPLLPSPVLSDSGNRVAKLYGIRGIPSMILLDNRGTVLSNDPGCIPVGGSYYTELELEKRNSGKLHFARYEFPPKSLGRTFPDFLAETMEGKPFRLRELRGKWVMLIVSRESCHACGGLSETLFPLIEAVTKQGGLCVWGNVEEKLKEGGKRPESFLLEIYDPFRSLNAAQNGEPYPQVYLLDPEGRIKAKDGPPFGSDRLKNLIHSYRTVILEGG